MQNVSQAFKNAIYAQTRQCAIRITLGLYDVTAASDAALSMPSKLRQAIGTDILVTENPVLYKLGSLEKDYHLLDGTFTLPSDVSSSFNGFVAWPVSDASGYFTGFKPILLMYFDVAHTVIGMTIDFDLLGGEPLADFSIIYYNAAGTIIARSDITGNTKATYVDQVAATNFFKIAIIAKRTTKPYRRARISRIVFGIILKYINSQTIEMHLLREKDLTMASLPSDELSLVLDNASKDFNILNPTGIVAFLQQRQKLEVEIGVAISDGVFEYAKMGEYFVTNWKSPSSSLRATFTARDVLDAISTTTFRKGSFGSQTLSALATAILVDAGVSKFEVNYTIHASLASIACTIPIPVVSHKEALRMVAEAGGCIIKLDKDSNIFIEPLAAGTAVDTLGYDKVYTPPEIDLVELTTSVVCDYTTFVINAAATELYRGVMTLSGTQDIWVPHLSPAYDTPTVTVTGGTLNNYTMYAYYTRLNITAAGAVTIVLSAKSVTFNTANMVVKHPTLTNGQELTIKNVLVDSSAKALTTAQLAYNLYQKRYKYITRWRQNPAIDLMDVVGLETDFGANSNAIVFKEKFDFVGALKGETESWIK